MPDTRQLKDLSVLLVDDEHRNITPAKMSGFLEREITIPETYCEAEQLINTWDFDFIFLDYDLRGFRDTPYFKGGHTSEDLWRIARQNSPRSEVISIAGKGPTKGYIYDSLVKLAENQDQTNIGEEVREEVAKRVKITQDLERDVRKRYPNLNPLDLPIYRRAEKLIYNGIDSGAYLDGAYLDNEKNSKLHLVQLFIAGLNDQQLENLYSERMSQKEFMKGFKERYQLRK